MNFNQTLLKCSDLFFHIIFNKFTMISDFEIDRLQEEFNLPFPKIYKINFSKHSINRICQRIGVKHINSCVYQIEKQIKEYAKLNSFYESSEKNIPLWLEINGRTIDVPVVVKPEVRHELEVITVWNKDLENN